MKVNQGKFTGNMSLDISDNQPKVNKDLTVGQSKKTRLSCNKRLVGGAEACSKILALASSAIEATAKEEASSISVTTSTGFSWV